jgi:transcriptional regulator with XRE-family HTH domain
MRAKRQLGPQASVVFREREFRALRIQAKLTQEELASQAGISIDAYRRAERGVAVAVETAIGSILETDYTSISESKLPPLKSSAFHIVPVT